MPKAIVFSRYGEPEVLHEIDIETPALAAGEVRVQVKAAGIAPLDWKLRSGMLEGRWKVTFPQRLGNEFAGIIDGVASDVQDLKLGDAVMGFTTAAAYADVIAVPANQVTKKPDAMEWEVAGALPVVGQGAYGFLKQLAVGPGDTLLIHAAAGGLGATCVQLARLHGASVVGTASPQNHDYLRSLGSTPVTYGPGLVERVRTAAPQGITVALDCIGAEAIAASVELVADRSRIGSVVSGPAEAEKHGIRFLTGMRSAEILSELAQLYVAGKLKLPVKVFARSDVAQAHRELQGGHVRGKLVLKIS